MSVTELPSGTVTFLTTDVVAYSRLFESDPDRMRRLVLVQEDLIIEQVHAAGGAVFKTVGDAVWAAFGSAPTAVRAALAIQSAKLACAELDGVEIRIALLTGEARPTGNDYREPALNRLSRICDVCPPGAIVVGPTTHALASDDFEFKLLGTFELKNVPDQVVYELIPSQATRDDIARKAKVRHNFPELDRPFVGREMEIADLTSLIEGRKRLVNVTAMGGMGKTTICQQIAMQNAFRFRDGAWLVECDGLESGTELVAAIAAILKLSRVPLTGEELAHEIADREALLVLDCFEGLAPLVGPLMEQLVRDTRGIHFLISSRRSLGTPREVEYSLGAMSTVAPKGRESDATMLFMEAAAQVSGAHAPQLQDVRLIAEIVTKLEGIPLAIVIAASRLKYMTAVELRRQIETNRLRAIKRAPLGDNDRHRDLIQVVHDSFLLLAEGEQRLLIALTVFHGFFLEDAETVLADMPEAVDGIFQLKDHNLVVAQVVADRTRFRLLDTIREFVDVAEGLEVPEAVRRAHAAHYTAIADDRHGDDSGFWTEVPNFREAIRFAHDRQDMDLLAPQARALARPLAEADMTTEFMMLAEHVEACPPDVQMELLGLEGILALRRGEPNLARTHWLRRLAASQSHHRPDIESDTLLDLCGIALAQHVHDEAGSYLHQFDVLVDAKMVKGLDAANGLVMHARLSAAEGDIPAAVEFCRKAVAIARTSNDSREVIYIWGVAGEVYAQMGAPSESLECLEHALRISATARYTGEANRLLRSVVEMVGTEDRHRIPGLLVVASKLPSGSRTTSEWIRAQRTRLAVTDAEMLSARSEYQGMAWHESLQRICSRSAKSPTLQT